MIRSLVVQLSLSADVSTAAGVMRSYIAPIVSGLAIFGSLACVFFLVVGGFYYMTSAGNPQRIESAKKIIRNALIGLVIILAAGALTSILSHAYASSAGSMSQKLPSLTSVKPAPVSNGLVDVLIKAITGVLNNIIQSAAQPFLKALSFFTTSTPLMAANSSVFNLWLAIVGMTDAMFVLVVALLGFNVMSYAAFGMDEIEFKHLLPQIGLIFLLINCSLFMIDGVISFSNIMINALVAGFGSVTVWEVLSKVVAQAGSVGLATLLIMIVFLVLAVILLVYYVGRIVTLYIGAVLSPLALLLWLVPGFREFSESAAKAYLTTIFVLFVHVVILQLAASLFSGLVLGSLTQQPDPLMTLVVGLATLVALLKTQGVLMQLSYVSIGPKTARKLGGQFVNGISYLRVGGGGVLSSLGNNAGDDIYKSRRTRPVITTSTGSSKSFSRNQTTSSSKTVSSLAQPPPKSSSRPSKVTVKK